ncbi:MAG TPA: YdjY domain-containing protein [Clostridia bacterium]|nr:YdjY domain-containing protein [Clostridia bacterium]
MKKVLSISLCILLVLALVAGCTGKPAAPASSEAMVVDKDKKEVSLLTTVNGKYFTEATRHGVVFKDGSNGEKSVLRAIGSEKDFNDALASIGAKGANNVKLDDKGKGVKIEGTKLNVFVTWEGLGKEIPFNDIIISSDPRPMDIRFGGNIENAKSKNTGCILCLDSCPVGITSNSSYAFGESDTVKFTSNKDVLPKDGTTVTVIFRLAE